MASDTRAIRFGRQWTCQVCAQTTATEWAMWRHLAEAHPTPGPGQAAMNAVIQTVDGGPLPLTDTSPAAIARRLQAGLDAGTVSLEQAAAALRILGPRRRQRSPDGE